MYRITLDYNRIAREWRVVKCHKVNPRWTTKVVDMDRRTKGRPKLRLLAPFSCGLGRTDPHAILNSYWHTHTWRAA